MKSFNEFLSDFIRTNFDPSFGVVTKDLNSNIMLRICSCQPPPSTLGAMGLMIARLDVLIHAAVFDNELYIKAEYSYTHTQGGSNGYTISHRFDSQLNTL